ncbi:flp pilus-assembly TadE/G-like family protein [Rhodococcus sp. MTM3W5.2]|nr:flp pilus-assembly TadE/G-like family protein [Rhodococcus sp. MTM3W5.2]
MRGERGAATVLACWAMLALIAVAALVIHLGSAVSARHRAQSAADLAALAAAAALERGTEAACAEATTIAGRMRGTVRDCRIEDWDVVVTVGVRLPLPAVGVVMPSPRPGRARSRSGVSRCVRRRTPLPDRKLEPHLTATNRLVGLTSDSGGPNFLSTVMSISVKPRLADRQPSSAAGCSG